MAVGEKLTPMRQHFEIAKGDASARGKLVTKAFVALFKPRRPALPLSAYPFRRGSLSKNIFSGNAANFQRLAKDFDAHSLSPIGLGATYSPECSNATGKDLSEVLARRFAAEGRRQ